MSSKQLNLPRLIALRCISRVEENAAFVDIILPTEAKKNNLGRLDTNFVNELVRGTIKLKKRLDWILDQFHQKKKKMPDPVRWNLWLALYQIEFLRTENYAAVSEAVNLAKSFADPYWAGVTNGILRNFLRNPNSVEFPRLEDDPVMAIAVNASHPEWLVKRWIDQFGIQAAQQLCEANNKVPPVSIRLNRLVTSPEQFENILRSNQIAFEKSVITSFYRIMHGWPLISDLLQKGQLTIQDESAGFPSLMAEPQPGSIIFDLCSAPGGKSTHMAEIAQDSALILAGDASVSRIKLVIQAKKRLNLRSIHTFIADARYFPAKKADTILLDAPCSGLGVLRRKPDMRWRRKPGDIPDLVKSQKQLLLAASRLLGNGGTLIYSTCTIEIEENENIINDFLDQHKNFRLAMPAGTDESLFNNHFIKTFPHVHGMDGSFAAKLVKVD